MAAPALRVVEGHLRVYRHTWRGSVISTFLSPILMLAAMGIGVGSMVDERGTSPAGLPFVTWLAPALLAVACMMAATFDSAYPVMAGIKWIKSYHAALSTPLGVTDLTLGHLGWVTVRLLIVSVVYGGVMVAFGATNPVETLIAIGPAILTGLVFGATVTAYTARLENESGLSSLFRFGITPLFLFSGTFFPIDLLPDWMEPVAFISPLWHGVELARAASLGLAPRYPVLLHLGVMVLWLAAATTIAMRLLRRRLVV
jgi:lipooligosaccharide transport system permease protein